MKEIAEWNKLKVGLTGKGNHNSSIMIYQQLIILILCLQQAALRHLPLPTPPKLMQIWTTLAVAPMVLVLPSSSELNALQVKVQHIIGSQSGFMFSLYL